MALYVEEWYSSMPSITKILFFIYLITGIVVEFLSSLMINDYFILNWNYLLTYVTSFLYIGKFLSITFWYELVLLLIYSKSLENEYLYFNRRKDYIFCLLFGVSIILFLSALRPLKPILLSQSLIFYIIYLYNNYKNPNETTVFVPALFIDNRYMIIILIFVNAVFGMFLWTEYLIGIAAGFIFMKLEQGLISRT
jgi:hypothetical protein